MVAIDVLLNVVGKLLQGSPLRSCTTMGSNTQPMNRWLFSVPVMRTRRERCVSPMTPHIITPGAAPVWRCIMHDVSNLSPRYLQTRIRPSWYCTQKEYAYKYTPWNVTLAGRCLEKDVRHTAKCRQFLLKSLFPIKSPKPPKKMVSEPS